MYSVVVTTLNEESFIADCLNSLLQQTVPPDEIIVVDASSSDRTVELASEYPVEIVQVDFHDVYLSKRTGAFIAKHDYVLCVDGDTALKPDFAEEAIKLLDEGYDVATCHLYPLDNNPITAVISWYYRNFPGYYSNPAYMVDKRSFIEACDIQKTNGISDRCTSYYEIPLHLFGEKVKSSQLKAYTDLPSTRQKKFVKLSLIIGTALMLT